jgi:hypothetical protein
MKRTDEQTEPVNAGEPGSVREGEDAPRAAFAPPVTNPSVLSLLNGLSPSMTPVPMAIPTTDGELSASYSAGPRRAPVAEETPAAEAAVVVSASTPGKTRAKAAPSRDRVDTTFRLRPRKYALGLPIALSVLIVAVGIAVWLGRVRGAEQAAPSVTPSVSVASPAVPPVQNAVPAPVPAPVESAAQPPVAASAVPPAPVTASPSSQAAPVPPTKRVPSRRKEDEPVPVL